MGSEKHFENRVKDFLKDQGCWFIKYWGGGEFTKSGIPDVLVCCKGCFIGLEIKAPRGRPSALQIMNLTQIHNAGGVAVLLYPKDFQHFKHLIENLKCGNYYEWSLTYKYFYDQWQDWLIRYRREGLLS